MHRLVVLAVVGALCGWSGTTLAEPPPEVIAGGNCPNAELLQAALARRRFPAAARAHRLQIEDTATGLHLALRNGDGALVLERTIGSDDCAALAEAAALIAETYFVEFAVRERGTNPAAPSAEGPAGRAEVTESTAPPVTAGPKTAATAPPAIAAAPQAAATPSGQRPPSSPPQPSPVPSRTSRRASRVELAIGGGIEALLDRPALSPAAQGALGVRLLDDLLHVEFHALTTGHVTLGEEPNRVSRKDNQFAIRVGHPVTRAFEPWAGAGAALTRLRLIDLAGGPTRTHWSPTLETGLTFYYPLSGSVSLRSDLGGHVFLVQESYEVTPDGRIGTGPRLGASLVIGVAWASPML